MQQAEILTNAGFKVMRQAIRSTMHSRHKFRRTRFMHNSVRKAGAVQLLRN